jgi:hypothetical protein
MAQWRVHGCTYRKIAAALNDLNNRTPQGNRWYASTVRAALFRNAPESYTSILKEAPSEAIPSITEGSHMPSNIQEAQRMIDVFTSVGARQFVVTKLDLEQRLKWCNSYSAVELRDKLPAMVRTAQERKKTCPSFRRADYSR